LLNFYFDSALANGYNQGIQTRIKKAYVRVQEWSQHAAAGRFDVVDMDGHIILPEDFDQVVQPGMSLSMRFWPGCKPETIPSDTKQPLHSLPLADHVEAEEKQLVSLQPPPPWLPSPPASKIKSAEIMHNSDEYTSDESDYTDSDAEAAVRLPRKHGTEDVKQVRFEIGRSDARAVEGAESLINERGKARAEAREEARKRTEVVWTETRKREEGSKKASVERGTRSNDVVFFLDRDLNDMEGIVNTQHPPMTPSISELQNAPTLSVQPDDDTAAWDAPDSWAVLRTRGEEEADFPEKVLSAREKRREDLVFPTALSSRQQSPARSMIPPESSPSRTPPLPIEFQKLQTVVASPVQTASDELDPRLAPDLVVLFKEEKSADEGSAQHRRMDSTEVKSVGAHLNPPAKQAYWPKPTHIDIPVEESTSTQSNSERRVEIRASDDYDVEAAAGLTALRMAKEQEAEEDSRVRSSASTLFSSYTPVQSPQHCTDPDQRQPHPAPRLPQSVASEAAPQEQDAALFTNPWNAGSEHVVFSRRKSSAGNPAPNDNSCANIQQPAQKNEEDDPWASAAFNIRKKAKKSKKGMSASIPKPLPVYPRTHKDHLDIQTLHYYDVPYEQDPVSL